MCPLHNAAVCGSNGVVYTNPCFLHNATCHDQTIMFQPCNTTGTIIFDMITARIPLTFVIMTLFMIDAFPRHIWTKNMKLLFLSILTFFQAFDLIWIICFDDTSEPIEANLGLTTIDVRTTLISCGWSVLLFLFNNICALLLDPSFIC